MGKKSLRDKSAELGLHLHPAHHFSCNPAAEYDNFTDFALRLFEEVMSLDRSDVEKIAHLARLAVSGDELDAVAGDLSSILEMVEQMSAVDTAGVTPMAHPLHMSQRLREDTVTEENQRELFQAISPQAEAGLYLVPKVIE
jgi:aspartyl-tRNA(Asn)/glutamyl-tRNA(Gln) amidotransferase subunit C